VQVPGQTFDQCVRRITDAIKMDEGRFGVIRFFTEMTITGNLETITR